MEYKDFKLGQVRRKKVIALSYIAAAILHIVLFFAFRVKFVPYMEVKVPRVIKVRRVRIPRGTRKGPLSASAARKRAKPKRVMKKSVKPKKKKRVKKKPKLKSKLKVPSKKKVEETVERDVDVALDQPVSDVDVLSMIEGEQVIAGGGNLGDSDDSYGLTYDDDMIYDPGAEEDIVVASKPVDDVLGTVATPIVRSKPRTWIEERFTYIPYPDEVKIKKSNLRSGISRVYLRLSIDSKGEIQGIYIRSPKTKEDKKKYKIFLDVVLDTVKGWSYEPKRATVFVDVRFTIE